MSSSSLRDALYSRMQWDFPDFEVRDKQKSWLMRLIYYGTFMFLWNRGFMDRYHTTIGNVIYSPGGEIGFETLAHEYVHLYDREKQGSVAFNLGYLFPQVLAVFALGAFGAFWTPWALLCLLFLVALVPWPAPWRTASELRAYGMNVAITVWRGYPAHADLEYFTKQFSSMAYYRMWWDEKEVFDSLFRIRQQALLGQLNERPYVMVRNILADHGELQIVYSNPPPRYDGG